MGFIWLADSFGLSASSGHRDSSRAAGHAAFSAALALMALLVLLCSPSPASAAQTRLPTGTTLGPDGAGGTDSFNSLQGVTTDPSSGDIYVLDGGETNGDGRLYKFTAAGVPANFSSLGQNFIEHVPINSSNPNAVESQVAVAPAAAVGGTAGNIYVSGYRGPETTVHIYSGTGSELGQIGAEEDAGPQPCGVATDPAGHVIVGFFKYQFQGVVREYTPTSNPPTDSDETGHSAIPSDEPPVPGLFNTCNVAVDGGGNIYASATEGEQTEYLNPIDGNPVTLGPGGKALTADPVTGELYLDTGDKVIVRGAADKGAFGPVLGTFGSPQLGGSHGVAISPDRQTVYVSNGQTGRVELYGPPLPAPDLQTGPPTNIDDTSARLTGSISAAGGDAANCSFEYVSEAAFAVSGYETADTVQCDPPGPFEGTATASVSALVSGLVRVTGYKYRIAGSTASVTLQGETESFETTPSPFPSPPPLGPCPENELFRAGPGVGLPDCRAYEQATPVKKNGGSASGMPSVVQAPEEGAAIGFYSQAGFPGGVGAQDFGTYVSSREGDGWRTKGLLPPQDLGEKAGVLGIGGNDKFAISQVISATGEVALAYRDLTSDETTLMVDYRRPCRFEPCFAFAGASSDGSRVFFESFLPVTEPPKSNEPEPEKQNLYAWEASTGNLTLVSRENQANPAGGAMPNGAFAGAYRWNSAVPKQHTDEGGAIQRSYVGAIHAVSNDGTRAIFTQAGPVAEPGEHTDAGQLYVRKNVGMPQSPVSVNPEGEEECLTPADACTVRVSAPQNGNVNTKPAAFLEATPDGRFIFFRSAQALTDDAGTGESGGSWNLYRYDVDTGSLVDLTPRTSATEESGPMVEGLVGASADGKVAYFVAQGELAPGGKSEAFNLYRVETGPVPVTTFVAELEVEKEFARDRQNWSPAETLSGPFVKTGRVSADGSAVVFRSTRSLTGYDNASKECGGDRCSEFFRWSVASPAPQCLSCNVTGARPLGPASVGPEDLFNATTLPTYFLAPVISRNLSADGNQFFFQTPDSLVARDTNGTLDVYEWEAAGSGSCPASEAMGCTYLLSGGSSEHPSYFGDANRDGQDVFIFTDSPLVPADQDDLYDAYDVSVGGGLASQWEEAPSLCGSGEACQGPRAQLAPAATPGSSIFQGPGNVKHKKPCKKAAKKATKKCKKKKHRKHRRAGKAKKKAAHRAASTNKYFGGAK